MKGVACVVNYDVPSSMAQYVHRVGRTARAVAGDADVSYGEAHTLLCRGSRDDEAFSKQLVNSLRGSTRSPPDADLYKFAKMKPIGASVSTAAPAAFSRPQSAAPVARNPLFAPPPATTAFAPPPTYAAPTYAAPPPPPPAHADADRAAAVEAARRIAARLAGGGYT